MTDEPPGWVADVLGPGVDAPRRLRWGFTNESWAATLAGGRRVAVTRMARRRTAAELLARGPRLAARLRAAGVLTPVPDTVLSDPARGVIVSDLIDGTTGAALLDSEGGPGLVGRLLGEARRRFATVDASGLGLDDLWGRPHELRAAALGWLEVAAPDLPVGGRTTAARAIDGLASLLGDARPAFVHGDLVPVNLLVLADGSAAILDLEAARIGEPLLDAGWFGWVVRYHHPRVAPSATAAFSAAAGIDPSEPRTVTLSSLLPAVRVLEILASPDLEVRVRRHWLDHLTACLDRLQA